MGFKCPLMADSVENSRAWFSPQKNPRLRSKSKNGAEIFGLGLHAAAHKKDVFVDPYSGCLRKPTFSTDSAVSGRLGSLVLSTIPRPIEGKAYR